MWPLWLFFIVEQNKDITRTHTHSHIQTFYVPLSRRKHSSTHTFPAHQPSFISFLHLPRTIASYLLNFRAWQSFCTTSNHVLFGLPLDLEPSTSYSITFLHSVIILLSKHMSIPSNLFCCRTEIMSTIPSLSLNSLFETLSFNLMPHMHLTILIYAFWSAISFSFLTGQVSLLCNILLRTQLLYSFLS